VNTKGSRVHCVPKQRGILSPESMFQEVQKPTLAGGKIFDVRQGEVNWFEGGGWTLSRGKKKQAVERKKIHPAVSHQEGESEVCSRINVYNPFKPWVFL